MKLKQDRRRAKKTRADARVAVCCTYCRDRLRPPERVHCASCLAPHHEDCFAEHGTCSAPGCDEDRAVRPEKKKRRRPRASLAGRQQLDQVALTSLILGVVAFMACGFVAPFAISKANEATRLARRLRAPVPAFATGGLVLGWLSLVGLILALVWLVVVLGMMIGA